MRSTDARDTCDFDERDGQVGWQLVCHSCVCGAVTQKS